MKKNYSESEINLIDYIIRTLFDKSFLRNDEDYYFVFNEIMEKNGIINSDLNWEIERNKDDNNVNYILSSDPSFVGDNFSLEVLVPEDDFLFFLKNSLKKQWIESPDRQEAIDEVIRKYHL